VRKIGAFTFLLLIGITLPAFSQGDPEGALDSAYIVCGKNAYFGSGTSQVRFQLRYWSDNTGSNRAVELFAALKISGANVVSVDTVVAKAYRGSGLEHFDILDVYKEGNQDPVVLPYILTYGAISFHGGITGESLWANITAVVKDTGTVCLDVFSEGAFIDGPFYFLTELALMYLPHWSGPYCCKVELHPPGDVNLDKNVNIVDVVAQVGYVFRQREPESVQAADVNVDCKVTLADIFYLANYVFKAGEKPKVGCIL